jgi:hypothetical protein
MKKFLKTGIFVGALAMLAGAAFAADDVFHTGETTVTKGSNVITIDNNVKYINYVEDDTLHVTLHFTATCNVLVTGLTAGHKEFTPKGVAGTGPTNVAFPLVAGASGDVTFDLQFTDLKKAGKAKHFGMAHLNLALSADSDCNTVTETPVNVGVQVSVSTADHP